MLSKPNSLLTGVETFAWVEKVKSLESHGCRDRHSQGHLGVIYVTLCQIRILIQALALTFKQKKYFKINSLLCPQWVDMWNQWGIGRGENEPLGMFINERHEHVCFASWYHHFPLLSALVKWDLEPAENGELGKLREKASEAISMVCPHYRLR